MSEFPQASGVSDVTREEALVEVARLYYLEGLDQAHIGRRLQVSRSTVSRMISEARQSGIVEIHINHPFPIAKDLRRRAVEIFGLSDALVLDADAARGSHLERVAGLTAQFLESRLSEGGVLATSWGSSLAAVAQALRGTNARGTQVVQMLGATGTLNPEVDGPELARTMARRLGGSSVQLNAPLLVDDPALAAALMRQRPVAYVLDQAAMADIALVGLGAMDPQVSSLVRAGFATSAQMQSAARAGVVGDLAGLLLAADGSTSRYELNDRMIRLDESRLRSIPTVVAIASGPAKVDVTRAALRSGIVHVLATDSWTLQAVLDG